MIFIEHFREGIITGHHGLFHCQTLGKQLTASVIVFHMNKFSSFIQIHCIMSNEYCKIYINVVSMYVLF